MQAGSSYSRCRYHHGPTSIPKCNTGHSRSEGVVPAPGRLRSLPYGVYPGPHLRVGDRAEVRPFGRYCRTSPLVCPFRPRSQKCWGRACPGRFPDSRSKSHLTGDAAFRPPDANNWPYGAIPGFPAKGAGKRGVALYGAVRRRTGRARGPVWCCRSRQGRAAPFLWRHRCGGHQRSPVRLCHAPSEAP